MRYKTLIFDMDGTILNTLEDLMNAVNYSLEKNGYPIRSLDEIRRFVGNGIYKLIERAVPDGLDKARTDRVYADMMEYYPKHSADKTCAYPGIPELLQKVRALGCKTAVVTNKADLAVKPLCERYFGGLFDAAVGEQPGINKKPAPDEVIEALRRLDCDGSDAVYIGDSEVDAATAENSHLPCILVSWGFRSLDVLKTLKHEKIVNSADELLKYIMGE